MIEIMDKVGIIEHTSKQDSLPLTLGGNTDQGSPFWDET